MIEISIRQSDQRLIAESDFTLPGGKEVKKGDEGGIVSACARIEKSWVSYESSVQGKSRIVNSFILDGSGIQDSQVEGSMILTSYIVSSKISYTRIDNATQIKRSKVHSSTLEDVKVFDSTVTESRVRQSYTEKSRVTDSRLEHCGIMDSTINSSRFAYIGAKSSRLYGQNHILSELVLLTNARASKQRPVLIISDGQGPLKAKYAKVRT